MKRFPIFILSFILLCFPWSVLSAQETFTDWKGINKITIKDNIHVSCYSTLYLLPIDEDSSIVKFEDTREKVVKQVFDQLAAFRPMILKEIKGAYKKLDVKIVDAAPDSLSKEDLVVRIKYTEFDLGSAALRGWTGGGNAAISIDATIETADCQDAVSFSQRHKSGLMSPNAYDKVLKEQQGKFAKDFVVIFKELEK